MVKWSHKSHTILAVVENEKNPQLFAQFADSFMEE